VKGAEKDKSQRKGTALAVPQSRRAIKGFSPCGTFYNPSMAIPSRHAGTGIYFVTSITSNRRRLFQIPANAELFIETLQHYGREDNYKLHAFVVMPDHIHLLLTPQGITLERVMGLIKGGFSHRLASKLPVWQRGFTDHRIRDDRDLEIRREYIHQNPVRARIAELPEAYLYSSACASKGGKAYLSG
jgi:putative transposase